MAAPPPGTVSPGAVLALEFTVVDVPPAIVTFFLLPPPAATAMATIKMTTAAALLTPTAITVRWPYRSVSRWRRFGTFHPQSRNAPETYPNP